MVNRYNRAIHYEDEVLGNIVARLEKLSRPAFMLYTSDHGEAPASGTWRLNSANSTYEIPFICWANDSFCKWRPELLHRLNAASAKPVQADEMFGTLMEIAGIRTKDASLQPASSLDSDFKPRNPRLIRYGTTEYAERKRKYTEY